MCRRAYLRYSEAEWKILCDAAHEEGFHDIRNFVHSRIRKALISLPENVPFKGRSHSISFHVTDEALINRLEAYCEAFDITVTKFVRRLATDPLILERLMVKDADWRYRLPAV